MARLSELAMVAGEAKLERNVLAKIVERLKTAGVDNVDGLSVDVAMTFDRMEYRTLRGILASSERNVEYWGKRLKRGR